MIKNNSNTAQATVILTYADHVETFAAPQDVLDDIRATEHLVRQSQEEEFYINAAPAVEGYEQLVSVAILPAPEEIILEVVA